MLMIKQVISDMLKKEKSHDGHPYCLSCNEIVKTGIVSMNNKKMFISREITLLLSMICGSMIDKSAFFCYGMIEVPCLNV